jgi:predicted  nucleic acid-binding Zn-ribbon protein
MENTPMNVRVELSFEMEDLDNDKDQIEEEINDFLSQVEDLIAKMSFYMDDIQYEYDHDDDE